MNPFLCVYLGSAFLAVVLTPGVIWLARRLGVVDPPGLRDVHERPVPRMGGVAIFLSTLVPLVVLLFVTDAVDEVSGNMLWPLIQVLCASALVFLVGLVDDLRHLPAKAKLVLELFIASCLCWAGARMSSIAGTDLWVLPLGGWGSLLTVLWIVGVTNAVNLSDGLDGLAAGICAVACGVLALFAFRSGETILVVFLLALLGSLCGFLLFNFHPARVFMGDSGSLFLGFTIGACSVLCVAQSGALVGLALPALALGIPICDTLSSALRRFLEGRSIFAPDRSHFHHRLLDLGLRHRQAVVLIYLATLLAAGLGLLMLICSDLGSWAIFAGGLLLILLLFRAVGAIRFRSTLARLQRKYAFARQARDEQRTFEHLQLYVRCARKPENGGQKTEAAGAWVPKRDSSRLGSLSSVKPKASSLASPSVSSFDWPAVCEAAGQLKLAWVALETTDADGSTETSIWRRQDMPPGFARIMTMSFPIHNMSAYRSVDMEIGVLVDGSLQSANHRAGLFVRLAEECLRNL